MNDYHEKLTKLLLNKNDHLSYNEARTWVELLWDDFETTFARAGQEYMGSEMTERVVKQWIENYGDKLHDFTTTNPKYEIYLAHAKNILH
ncbi:MULTISPECIES: YfhJ family protein [Neobacillus]|uniref:YfhJ family protein n=1 Tax=Neobacillus citreus TaxID=2833578 RepID=A0A942T8H1_9BACI|nr:YfhJ family protein [Neobacillus citreus]MCH6267029.1 YfhJ family protein [Neobacillus citreus]